MRHSFKLPVVLLVVLLGPVVSPVQGQGRVQPQALWFRGTVGMARLHQECQGCIASGVSTSTNLNLAVGYAWPGLALGIEFATIRDQDSDVSQRLYLLTGSWYPFARAGAFIKVGVGASDYLGLQTADGVMQERGSGVAGQFELGIDLSMGDIAITPLVSFQYAHQNSTAFQGIGFLEKSRGLSQWNVGFAVGLTVL